MSELPTGWSMATLSEVAAWGSGGTPRAGDARYYGGPIPWAIIGDLTDGLVLRTGSSLTEQGLAESSAKLVEPGTVLVAMYGSIGKLGIAGVRMATNQAIAFARPRACLDAKYLFWFLRSERDGLSTAGKGATQRNISQTILRSWPVPVAPIDEQRRIVAAIEEQFSRLDAAEASLHAAKRRLDALRRAVLGRAVEGDWPVSPLEDIMVSLRNGIFVSRPQAKPPGIPIFRISAVRPLSLNVDDIRFADIEPERATGYLVQDGDLLFTRYSGNPDYVGACARVTGLPRPTLHPDKLIRVEIDRTRAESAFVAIALSTGVGRRAIEGHRKTTAGQVGIAGSELKKVPIPLPPIEQQKRIVAEVERQLSILVALSTKVDETLSRSAALGRSVLERAFSGKLVVQDPADEPASVLLERIAATRASELKASRRRKKMTA